MSVSTERHIRAPPTATPTLTVCHSPSLRSAPTLSVLEMFSRLSSSLSWPPARLSWNKSRAPALSSARTNWPDEEQERKEKPRREPGLNWRLEDKDIEEETRLRRASESVEGGALLNWLLWTEGRRRSKKAYMRPPVPVRRNKVSPPGPGDSIMVFRFIRLSFHKMRESSCSNT